MKDVDKILEDELGNLGALGGGAGGGLPGSIGGGTGGRFGARLLRSHGFEVAAEVNLGTQQALALYTAAATQVGRVMERQTGDGIESIIAIVGAGFFKMNPAVVEIELTVTGSESCRILIRGTAKEGLIKQRTAERAIERVLDAANGLAPGSTTALPPATG